MGLFVNNLNKYVVFTQNWLTNWVIAVKVKILFCPLELLTT